MKMTAGMLRRVVWLKLSDVSEVLAASIIRAIIYQTKRRNITEDIHLHTTHNSPSVCHDRM
jgi:hypothetical protein